MKSIEVGTLTALIDDEDFDLVRGYVWRPSRHAGGHIYAQHCSGGKTILMHRLIVNAPRGVFVDHKNREGLDNRRENLRLCSHAENMRNRKLNSNNTSGFKGVEYRKGCDANPWRARIRFDKKSIELGLFATPEEASAAYIAAAKKLHGDFMRLA